MSEERKKPVWPWIVAMLIGLPVLYVLSWGPACWLAVRIEMAESRIFQVGYWPIGRIIYVGVPVADATLVAYAEFGLPPAASLTIPGGPDDEGNHWSIVGDLR